MTFSFSAHRHPGALPSADTTHLLPTLVRHHDLPSSRVLFFCVCFFPLGETLLFADRMFRRQWTPNGFLFDSQPHSRSCRHFCDATTATPYPNIPVGLSSEPVGLSLSGYESFEPGIGLGGLVLTPPVPTTITIPPLPSSEL